MREKQISADKSSVGAGKKGIKVSKYFSSSEVEKVKDGVDDKDKGVMIKKEVHDTGTVPVVAIESTDQEKEAYALHDSFHSVGGKVVFLRPPLTHISHPRMLNMLHCCPLKL